MGFVQNLLNKGPVFTKFRRYNLVRPKTAPSIHISLDLIYGGICRGRAVFVSCDLKRVYQFAVASRYYPQIRSGIADKKRPENRLSFIRIRPTKVFTRGESRKVIFLVLLCNLV